MLKTKAQYYLLIQDLISKEDFEREIKKRFAEYGELMSEDAIAFMIVDELGRNKLELKKLKDLEEGKDFTGFVTVTHIYDYRKFTRKDGTQGRVVNLDVKDDTSIARVVLWDKDVDLVANNFITKNTNLKIVNGFVKKSKLGLEINIGRDSFLVIEPEDFPSPKVEFTKINNLRLNYSKSVNIRGKVIEKMAAREFLRKDGSIGAIGEIKLEDETGKAKIIFWDERAKELERIKLGNQLEILDAYVKSRNGVEIHIGKNTVVRIS